MITKLSGVLVAPRAGDLLADADLHRAVVEQPGQRVGAGGLLDLLVGLGVVAGDGGEVGDRLERPPVLLADPPHRVQPTDSAPRSSSFHAIGTAIAVVNAPMHRWPGRVDVAPIVVGGEALAAGSDLAGGAFAGSHVRARATRRATP